MIRRETDEDEEITHDELLEYYREYQDEYSFSAKARWEILSAHFDKANSKNDAYRKAAMMGNAILRGAPLDVIARKESDDITRCRGRCSRLDDAGQSGFRSFRQSRLFAAGKPAEPDFGGRARISHRACQGTQGGRIHPLYGGPGRNSREDQTAKTR